MKNTLEINSHIVQNMIDSLIKNHIPKYPLVKT